MDNSAPYDYTVATVRTGNSVAFLAGGGDVVGTAASLARTDYFSGNILLNVTHTGRFGDKTDVGAAGNAVEVTQATAGVLGALTEKEKTLAGLLDQTTKLVEAKDKELAQVRAELVRVNQSHSDLRCEVSGNRATIAEQKRLLEQKDAIIAEQKKLLEKKDADIREPDPRALKFPRLDTLTDASSPPSATAALRLPPITTAASTPPPDVGYDPSSIQAIVNRAMAVCGTPKP